MSGGAARRRIALAGLGAVGMAVARALAGGRLPDYKLAAVSARDREAVRARLAEIGVAAPVVELAELEAYAEVVVEAAPAALLPDIATPFLEAGKTVVVLSAGALLDHEGLVDVARVGGGRIVVPSGAILGLDAMLAAQEGEILSVRMTTRKPVAGLADAPWLRERGIDIAGIAEPVKVFEGTPREAAKGFPANLNVAVALSLAGFGVDRTRLEIWADPSVTRNIHRVEVESTAANFSMTIENVPSENPRTGRITALSVLACLRKLTAPLAVGT